MGFLILCDIRGLLLIEDAAGLGCAVGVVDAHCLLDRCAVHDLLSGGAMLTDHLVINY